MNLNFAIKKTHKTVLEFIATSGGSIPCRLYVTKIQIVEYHIVLLH